MTTTAPYRIRANNLSRASDNKIHDDTVAKQFGFTGGLVPGVEVYAYMTQPVVVRWGRSWLERGTMTAKFSKPLYDGRVAEVTAIEDGDGLALSLSSDGVLCATGVASLPSRTPPPALKDFVVRRPPAVLPMADEVVLAAGTWFGIEPIAVTQPVLEAYRTDVGDSLAVYAREGLAHPGWLLRACNAVLYENVALGPWIHTGSQVQNFAIVPFGAELSARGRVMRITDRKGHKFVDLDIILVTDDRMVVAHVAHTAIYRLRQST